MDIDTIDLSQKTYKSIQNLRMKVELTEKKRVRKVKTVEDLMTLLRFSQRSDFIDVDLALQDFTTSLSPDQLTFFKTLGFDASKQSQVSTDTSTVDNEINGSNSEPKFEHLEKRKKMIYRGKVVYK